MAAQKSTARGHFRNNTFQNLRTDPAGSMKVQAKINGKKIRSTVNNTVCGIIPRVLGLLNHMED
jgi:hypothetical protein